MLAALLASHIQVLVLGACVPGTVVSCTLSGCARAQKVCEGPGFGPCECLTPGCVNGAVATCSLASCALAQQTCVGTSFGPCTCVIQTCDDGNPCTTDALSGNACTHGQLPPGSACNDSNACTTTDRCDASGRCTGTPVPTDDGNPCTFDRCYPATGAITHPLASSEASCSSGTFFCYDKYGNVTRKVVCIAGAACDTNCP